MLDPSVISSIIGGASGVASQLIGFGTQMALIGKQKAPISNNTVEINLPGLAKGGIDYSLLIIAFVIILMVFAVVFVVLKLV